MDRKAHITYMLGNITLLCNTMKRNDKMTMMYSAGEITVEGKVNANFANILKTQENVFFNRQLLTYGYYMKVIFRFQLQTEPENCKSG